MQEVLQLMSAWALPAAFAILAGAKIWRKRRRRIYSRELMQKLARTL